MTSTGLTAKRVLITQANAFMGPALCEVFAEHGATDTRALIDVHLPAAIAAAAGRVDVVLLANLALTAPSTHAVDASESEWQETFTALVDPLPLLVRAVLPQMIARRSGKILLIGSASALQAARVHLQRRARRTARVHPGRRRRGRPAQ